MSIIGDHHPIERKGMEMNAALEAKSQPVARTGRVFESRNSSGMSRLRERGSGESSEPSAKTSEGWVAESASIESASIESPSIESAFVERARAGDPQAFASLYGMYRPNVHRFLMKRVRNRSDAEDLTQETFVQAFRSISVFEGRSRILTWLLGIARFVHLRSLRSASRRPTVAQAAPFESELGCEARTDLRVDAARTLDRCVDILEHRRKPRDQKIFYLRYFEQMSVCDIAADNGMTTDSVKTSLWRSRMALKRALEPLDLAAA
jgi:RNA polymerase sigma-70 factor (ECF subfamily)